MDDAARRRELRRIARRLHPDVGGDPEQYVAAVARLERAATGVAPAGAGPVRVRVRRTGGARALVRRARRRWRAWARARFVRRRRRTEEDLSRRARR